MTADVYKEFEHKAIHHLIKLNEECERHYKIGSYKHWDYDQDKGELHFSDDGVTKVTARFQVVGSISAKTKTWLWSWANDTIEGPLTAAAIAAREFGENEHVEKLTNEYWSADEQDGWEMAAVTAKLTKAKGAYRCPDKNGFLFVIFTDIRFATQ